ncbi:MAG: DUF4435 domain-containing protein [Desulfobacula sp.]|nr:DUF4435 domain-containing protein [Desulfobacula sp.]
MTSFRRGIRSEEIRLQSQHVLFVEGKDQASVDPKVLRELFDPENIRIEPLGPSFSVKSVAQALYSYHPNYYFLIDRDHHDENFVDQCWDNFPDPDKHNLLVWRKREIENYFLDPLYLSKSSYCVSSQQKIEKKILEFAGRRLFLDAANYVIISIREELKKNWITKFSNPEEFSSKEKALTKLKNTSEFEKHKADVGLKVSTDELEHRFNNVVEEMMGNTDKPIFGEGKWLNMVQGKKVLSQVVNSGCFTIPTTDGSTLSGKEKLNAVAKDLLKKDTGIQPIDFHKLKELIRRRIRRENIDEIS